MVIAQSEYTELVDENIRLKDENLNHNKNIDTLNETIDNLQINNDKLNERISLLEADNSQLQKENDNLQKGIENLKTENKALEDENQKLKDKIDELINGVDDSIEQVSIFTLETFSGRGGWRNSTYSQSSFTDTYGNAYQSAYEALHIWEGSSTYNSPPVYLLDRKYSKCQGQLAWPKEQKDKEGRIWIEFYGDDELLYTTEKISADDRVFAFEFDVSNVEKLKIYRRASVPSVYAIYPYLNLV